MSCKSGRGIKKAEPSRRPSTGDSRVEGGPLSLEGPHGLVLEALGILAASASPFSSPGVPGQSLRVTAGVLLSWPL